MRTKLIIFCLFLMFLPHSSQAQWTGIGIRIPNGSVDGTGNAVTISGGGGGGIPSNAMTFNGQVMTFNGQIMTYSGNP